MSVRTRHYHDAVEKIHHREIEDYQPEIVREYYPEFNLMIVDGVTCIESKIKFSSVEIMTSQDNSGDEEFLTEMSDELEIFQESEFELSVVSESYFQKSRLGEAVEGLMSFYSSLLRPQTAF